MNLIRIEIENFGSIKEKQSLTINKGITTLIGLNESGKTTILNAIYKLNGESIEDDEKNKHSDYKTKDSEISGIFELNEKDLINIEKSNPLIKLNKNHYWTLKVTVKSNDDSMYYGVYCDDKYFNMNEMIKNNLLNVIGDIANSYNVDFKLDFNDNNNLDLTKEFKKEITAFQTKNVDFYNKVSNYEKCINWIHYFPEFRIIKFDNKNILGDTIEISKISTNLQANNFFKISNTNIENLVNDPLNISDEYKANIENNCEVKISEKFKKIFRQNDDDIKFKIRIDDKNNRISFYINDSTSGNNNIPLSKRSDGFNWYFSIYLTLYEYLNKDASMKHILLFDEPNLYLNPSTQIDLLNRVFKQEFEEDQIIFSTHSPYMIDSNDFKSIRIVEKKNETKIFNNIPAYSKENKIRTNEVDLLTPIFSALQLSVSNSLVLDNDIIPIIVEGLQDHYILNAMIKKTKYDEKMKKYKIIPCVGVDKAPLVYSYLFGMGYTVVVLFDGDSQGKNVIKKLEKELKDIDGLNSMLLTYSIVFDDKKDAKLEDLLCSEDLKLVDHDKTLTYKEFFEKINELKLNKNTIDNFTKLFNTIIKITS